MTASRIGSKVRITLIGNLHYSGTILEEDTALIIIRDKFGSRVSLGKAAIVSMEELL